jgi:ABC-type bacteriocin/lantibiotic exporter with double-glycine peptidase domain
VLELYKAIWRVSARRQIVLILLSIAVAALAAVPLKFQKDITNGLTDATIDQAYLFWLCGGMIAAIILSLGLKWLMGWRASILGEDVIRVIRNRVYATAAGPEGATLDTSIGTLTTIVSAEAEELGKFTGSAFSEPVVQIGTLISVVGFIMSTQPGLGLIALCMIAPQIIVVLSTQTKVNSLVGERIRILRQSTDRISASDLSSIDDQITRQFDDIYDTRRRLFFWKLSTKFLLSTITGVGTVAVLALGGALVLADRTDVGTVVATTIGLGRLQGPTSFLIAFYRQVSSTRVKFDLLRDAARPATA